MSEDRELHIEELRLLVACEVLVDAEVEGMVEHGRAMVLQVKAPGYLAGMQVNVAGNERTFLEDLVKIGVRRRGEAEGE